MAFSVRRFDRDAVQIEVGTHARADLSEDVLPRQPALNLLSAEASAVRLLALEQRRRNPDLIRDRESFSQSLAPPRTSSYIQ
jgi:hypothetical protein